MESGFESGAGYNGARTVSFEGYENYQSELMHIPTDYGHPERK